MAIDNSQKILKAVNNVTIELIKVLKKGGGPVAEVIAIVNDLENQPDFMKSLQEAVAAFPAEGAELKTLSTADALALVVTEAESIPAILAAVHGS